MTDWLRDRLAPEGAALDLAMFRITVALVILTSTSVEVADTWAALPAGVRTAPLGVGWLVSHLPIEPTLVQLVRAVLYAACVSGAIGFCSRASFTLVAITGSYVLLVPQLGGAVFHDHHLVWFAALLAASPCGDALSIDAWRRPRPTHGRAHGAAVRCVWILIGLVFLFPGVHKLASSGLDWVLSDNLRNQLWWKWAQDPALEPAWRIDRYPALLRSLAGLTVAFELGFLPLVFWRRTRPLVVLGAIAFHLATDHFMGVRFTVLMACYTVFVPWAALLRRPREGTSERSVLPVAAVGGALMLGVAVFGAMGAMQAYPFACYPTFEWIAADRMPGLEIEVEHHDGTREPLPREHWMEGGPRGWALEWRLAGVYDRPDLDRLRAWWTAQPICERYAGARRIHFRRIATSVDPERRGQVVRRRPIGAIDGGC